MANGLGPLFRAMGLVLAGLGLYGWVEKMGKKRS